MPGLSELGFQNQAAGSSVLDIVEKSLGLQLGSEVVMMLQHLQAQVHSAYMEMLRYYPDFLLLQVPKESVLTDLLKPANLPVLQTDLLLAQAEHFDFDAVPGSKV